MTATQTRPDPPVPTTDPSVETVISLEGVSKTFGDTRALDDVSFEVRAGEVFGLLGPNGAGKTTLLEILEGHGVPDSGRATVLGVNPRVAGARLRDRLGIVPQVASFELYLTVREHLQAYGAYFSRNYPVDDLIELVGLQEKAKGLVGRLSGGQQRRLDLALALIGDPDIVFLDEPTTGFDVEARDQAWHVIDSLRNTGKTIILTTHNMAEAQALVDRVGVIHRGRMAAVGTPDQLLADDRARITFSASEVDPASLPGDLSQAVRIESGEIVLIRTDSLGTLRALMDWADATGMPLRDLRVERPTLEDLYVAILREQRTN